jgi:hypothetical protein
MTANTDIVLGVTRAADAARQKAAVSRLEKLSGQASGTVDATAQTADPAPAWSTEVRLAAAGTSRPAKLDTQAPTAGPSRREMDVYVQFEALLMKDMIEAMLPQDAETVFGSGTAGNIWKSMLAEQVAFEIARTGSLGIAKTIAQGEAAASAARAPAQTKVDGA